MGPNQGALLKSITDSRKLYARNDYDDVDLERLGSDHVSLTDEETAYESYINPEPGFQSGPGDSVDAD